MSKGIFWTKSSVQRQLSKIIVSVFTLSTILMTIPAGSKIPFGSPKVLSATTNVADQPNLGNESYWNFEEHDLGADWIAKVNTATGNMVINKNLVSITGRGLSLGEQLTYNSFTQQNVGMGLGWTLGNGLFLQENADGSVTFKDEDATNHTFTKNTDGTYTAPPGIHYILTKLQTGVFTIKDTIQTVYRFENKRPTTITDEKGNVTLLTYDANGNLTKIKDPSGRSLVYAYDTNSRLSSITDPASRKLQFSYDSGGRLVEITDTRNNRTQFEYDSTNRLTGFIDANGKKTSFSYDSNRRIIKIIDGRSNATTSYEKSFSYDTSTLTTTVTDAAGKKVFYVHNSSNNLIQIKNGVGDTNNFTWDQNEIVQSSDSKGSTSLQYDDSGNVTQVSEAISDTVTATTNIQYDSNNNPVEVTDPNQHTSITRYDENSNEISSVNPHRREADGITYDANGNVKSITSQGAPTYNLLENGSFERQNASTGEFIAWTKGGNTGAISKDSNVAIEGKQSVKISSTT